VYEEDNGVLAEEGPPLTAVPHPTDSELFDFAAGVLDDDRRRAIAKHVATCPECNHITSDAMSDWHVATPAFAEASGTAEIVGSRDRDPAVGDVWRATWDDVGEIVLVVRVDADYPYAAPVVVAAPEPDSTSYLWPATDNPFGSDASVFVSFASPLPPCVFDEWLTDGPKLTGWTAPSRQRPDIAQLSWRAHLLAAMAELATATWIEAEDREPQRLSEALAEAGLTTSAAARALGLQPRDLTLVNRGKRGLSDQELERLAELGVTTQRLLRRPNVDTNLARDLDRPRWKPAVRREMRKRMLDEARTRSSVALEAQQLAARVSKEAPTAARDWTPLIAMVLGA